MSPLDTIAACRYTGSSEARLSTRSNRAKVVGPVVSSPGRGWCYDAILRALAMLPVPPQMGSPLSKYYADLGFAKEHGWNEFLSRYLSAVRG